MVKNRHEVRLCEIENKLKGQVGDIFFEIEEFFSVYQIDFSAFSVTKKPVSSMSLMMKRLNF